MMASLDILSSCEVSVTRRCPPTTPSQTYCPEEILWSLRTGSQTRASRGKRGDRRRVGTRSDLLLLGARRRPLGMLCTILRPWLAPAEYVSGAFWWAVVTAALLVLTGAVLLWICRRTWTGHNVSDSGVTLHVGCTKVGAATTQ